MERELETETTAAATESPITTVAVAPEPEVCDYSLVGQPCEEGSTCVIDTTECCGETLNNTCGERSVAIEMGSGGGASAGV
eukprot:scaffold157_cov80-Skeletonema_dohrnii-CCMP3373.AAC.2